MNKPQYNSFWLRDAAIISNAFDLAGLHAIAGENLDFFPFWQRDDGLFISRKEQYDGFGQALWAFGQHARRTRDRDFARRALGPVRRAMTWLAETRARDPLGLLPAGTPGDNELTSGHITGDNFWAVAGAREAASLAELAGRGDLAAAWRLEAESLRATVDAAVRRAAERSGGPIPPALDTPGGEYWGNLWASYPERVLQPDDPAVSATIERARARFRGGIATYFKGRLLHHYLGFRVFQTELLRGEQRRVVDGLYSELAHTTATHGGFETGVRRRGRREIDENLAPHGWFAAEYVALLRNMLVREDGTDLVLMSALSPAWLRPGRAVAVRGADTTRGQIDYELRAGRTGAVLRWRSELFEGTKLRWPVPEAARQVRSPGLSADGRTITLPAAAGSIRVRWRIAGPLPSYRRTAASVLRLYARR